MRKIKIHIFLCVCIISILSFVGCSSKKVTVPASSNAVPTLSASGVVEVKDLLKQLNAEKQVSGSQIFIQNNVHYAVITFKKDADSKNAKEFATKYANLIKKAYSDKNVNLKIVQNEKDIASVVLK